MSELRSTGASRGRVLAIDDDRAMTDVLERQLAMEGFEVTVSTDAAAALELLPAAWTAWSSAAGAWPSVLGYPSSS